MDFLRLESARVIFASCAAFSAFLVVVRADADLLFVDGGGGGGLEVTLGADLLWGSLWREDDRKERLVCSGWSFMPGLEVTYILFTYITQI